MCLVFQSVQYAMSAETIFNQQIPLSCQDMWFVLAISSYPCSKVLPIFSQLIPHVSNLLHSTTSFNFLAFNALLRRVRTNKHHQLCLAHHLHHLQDHGQLHVKGCNPRIRSWITTLAPEVAESVMHLLCRCTHHPEMGFATPTPSTPFAYACPAMGTTSSSPQIGAQQGRITNDEVRKDRSPLPKLVIIGGDATILTRVINEWSQKTTISLNTWSQSAATFWAQVVGMAGQRHNWWLSLSPDQRAMHTGLPTTGQTIPLQLPILEATMRAELLNNVLPERVQTASMENGATTVLDLLFITFQTYLPSEPSARVEGLTTVEAPLKASKNFQEALTTLRSWRQHPVSPYPLNFTPLILGMHCKFKGVAFFLGPSLGTKVWSWLL